MNTGQKKVNSKDLWLTIVDETSDYIDYLERKKLKPSMRIRCLIDEIMLTFLYPRLDANVSTTINHLLKGPFCIHPKTCI